MYGQNRPSELLGKDSCVNGRQHFSRRASGEINDEGSKSCTCKLNIPLYLPLSHFTSLPREHLEENSSDAIFLFLLTCLNHLFVCRFEARQIFRTTFAIYEGVGEWTTLPTSLFSFEYSFCGLLKLLLTVEFDLCHVISEVKENV
ncbi:hypothetical protein CEXT_39221 [Caerostris extrusa]|uniref:Uncharacterized protein n=1 Tax=Caerostris extrusa TaxID=172846 RepID=A0AAV4X393_CAEEX|nr:hypothetical protein CEXT_39221 [Caerostris extrusa]